ncbi:MAG: DUF2946 domain-containing protein [Burkholderiaceae bacterium]|nr:DUF2946 domain-containing protein [Burkholderiaceae bacterium]
MDYRDYLSHRLTAWIATLAILFGAFSPAVGHALAKASGLDGQYLAVCTSTGVQYVKLDLDSTDDQPAGIHQVQSECAWCFSALHAPGLPGFEHQQDFSLSREPSCQSAYVTGPGSRASWTPSLARAPPSLT